MTAAKSRGTAVRTAILLLFVAFCLVARPDGSPSHIAPRVLGERLIGSGASPGAAVKDNANGVGSAKKSFSIDGDVDELYPGTQTTLELSIKNSNNFPIIVNSITVDVANASASCLASVLSVDDFDGALDVPKNGLAVTTVAVSLDPSASADCENATWPLSYTGTAVKK
jgi:hypothetical protein